MKLCRVTGNVVATVKHETYRGQKIMVVQPVDERGANAGETFLAVDWAQAGPGDLVLVMQEGNGVRQIYNRGRQGAPEQKVPIRSVIIGVVDAVDVPA